MRERYRWRSGNRVELLVDGDHFFPAMLQAIQQAQSSLLLEFYMVSSGRVASQFITALIDAAGRGVLVRWLVDDFGARRLSVHDCKALTDAGVALERYNPTPEVVFSMPLAGEKSVPLNSEFRIQFSKDMDDASFDRNVDLIYADDGPDEHSFPDMQISYDRPSRSLVVIPAKVLEPGKEIRLILYRGITDNEGRPLVPDPDASEVPEAAVILSFFTEGPV